MKHIQAEISDLWQHSSLTTDQLQARLTFDLDAAMNGLPPVINHAKQSTLGHAGVRLHPRYVADISDDLLREFAGETLGAKRCGRPYLNALRVVLGNQARAERHGLTLEMNRGSGIAPDNVMRNIINQMHGAGITQDRRCSYGSGQTQVVQCFVARRPTGRLPAAEELCRRSRQDEAADAGGVSRVPANLLPDDIPH